MGKLQQRRETLERISLCAITMQESFIRNGVRELRPLTRADVAAHLGIHESTVSRATAGKFVMLPNHRVVPFSDFFSASLSAKDAIRELIEREAASGRTLSDREIGQRLLIDLTLEVGEVDATVTDLVEDTVDYGEVCNTVSLVAQQRSYKTLERLSTAIADRLLADYTIEAVSVKCAKPEPPIALPVEEVSVTVWREPED